MANHYILESATGADDGTDWTDAWTVLPSSLTRGDTYYIGDGTYTSHIFNDAESGSSYITIQKATESDHGTETGWSSAFGDGQAIFTATMTTDEHAIINFLTGYYIWTGVTGSGGTQTSYGFKIIYLTTGHKNFLMGAPSIGFTTQVDHLQVSYTAFISPSESDWSSMAFYADSRSSPYGHDITITNNYFYSGNVHISLRRIDPSGNVIIENNYFDSNWSSSAAHGGVIVSNTWVYDVTVKDNYFDTCAIFHVDLHPNKATDTGRAEADGYAGASGWDIYNNIFVDASATDPISTMIGSTASGTELGIISSNIHHNTVINVDPTSGFLSVHDIDDVPTQKSFAYNNLFYNVDGPHMDNVGYTSGAIIHTNNAHYNSSGTYDGDEGGTAIDTTGDPFTDSGAGDYTLTTGTAAIDAGKTLSAPYTTDYAGITRPQGAGFDIGAYEHVSSTKTLLDYERGTGRGIGTGIMVGVG